MKVKRKKWTEFWGKEWSKKSFQIIGTQDDQEHLHFKVHTYSSNNLYLNIEML